MFLAGVLADCAAESGPFVGPNMETMPPGVLVFDDGMDGTVRAMGADDQGAEYFIFKVSPDGDVCLLMVPQGDAGRGCAVPGSRSQ